MYYHRMMDWLNNREHRKWLYGISVTAIPLLVGYGVLSEHIAPLWIAFAGSFLAPTLALSHLSPEEEDEAS
jgi:hypothetical protein